MNNGFPIVYNPNAYIVARFINHGRFALYPELPHFEIQKNILEKCGDLGLWMAEKFPGKAWRLMKEPRWVTIVLTCISLFGVSLLFYRKETIGYAERFIAKFPLPSYEQAKFATYLAVVGHIFAASSRAYGRFSNEELMKRWYSNNAYMLQNQ